MEKKNKGLNNMSWFNILKNDEFYRFNDVQNIRNIVKDYFQGTKIKIQNVRVYPRDQVVIVKTNIYMEEEPKLSYLLRDKTGIKWDIRWE
jgi:hypothetical protein